MKIYQTVTRPVVTYWSETGTVTAKDENNLRIFKGKYRVSEKIIPFLIFIS
jgi:hypothetical protein